MKRKAIFLDRDGVLIEDTHLITSINQLKPIAGVKDALLALKAQGYLLFILSNQSVVSRGLISKNECEQLHQSILEVLKVTDLIEESYLCPYHPDAQVIEYRQEHKWRKPGSGALEYWALKYNIDMSKSYMLGDRATDMTCAKSGLCKSVFIGEKLINEINPDFHFKSVCEFSSTLKKIFEVGNI